MRKKSASIHAKITADQRRSRINQVEEISTLFRFSLPNPRDFYPSAADICWIPEVRKAIIDGTDKEFQDCIVDIRSRISELSATWLEERRNFFLQFLPQDPPTLQHLSLATTFFDCVKCHTFDMRIERALSHCCLNREYVTQFSGESSAQTYDYHVNPHWDSGFARYRYSAELTTVAREIILECGENPDTITTQEMSGKHHRFVRFDTNGTVGVLNWVEAVSSGALLSTDFMPHLRHAVS